MSLTMGLRIVTTKSVKTLRRTRLRRRVLQRARSRGGAVNKYTFRKVSQIVRIRKCKMHVFSQGLANMLSQKYFSFQALANAISHAFASFVHICKYGFAVFRKLSQFMVSQAFARIRKDSQMDFRRDSPRIRKCENHGFSQ